MAERTSGSVMDDSTIPNLEVDVFGRISPEPQQTLEEVVGQDVLLMTGDDSVFYSEDEEAPQQVFSTNSNPELPSEGPVWSAELWSAPSHSPTKEGSLCHSDAMLEEAQRSLKDLSSPATSQRMEDQTEAAFSKSTTYGEELEISSAVKGTRSSSSEVVEKMTEISPMLPMCMETERQERAQEWESPCSSSCADALKCVSPEQLEQGREPNTPNELGNDFGAESEKLFNHLTHEKYGTVSYRQIRRGQTRRRIEEFESMMQL